MRVADDKSLGRAFWFTRERAKGYQKCCTYRGPSRFFQR